MAENLVQPREGFRAGAFCKLAFGYRGGVLHVESVPVPTIAAACGTPVYIYSADYLRQSYLALEEALSGLNHLICYAMKANSNQAVLKLFADLGAGFDAVSIGEYVRARRAGADGSRIVFSGVGKTEMEMRSALEGGLRHFNVESEPELRRLSRVALSMGIRAPVAIRINPDVDAETHEKISTGKAENKFGVPLERARSIYAEAASLSGIDVVGIDLHIGSQIQRLEPFETAYRRVASLVPVLRNDGHDIGRIDIGGGLGISYRPGSDEPIDLAEYGAMVRRVFGQLDAEIEIEPGRLIAGNAGLLVATVIYRKTGSGRCFLVVDAAMNDLQRPAMYDAWHEIVPIRETDNQARLAPVDVVGPVCETSDTFARQRKLPEIAENELVGFLSAGAYAASMASEYNTRPLVPEVLASGERFSLVRSRPGLDDIIANDRIPDWL